MAKWSDTWKDPNLKYWQKKTIGNNCPGYCPPMPAKKKSGGKSPHLQPFFKNRSK